MLCTARSAPGALAVNPDVPGSVASLLPHRGFLDDQQHAEKTCQVLGANRQCAGTTEPAMISLYLTIFWHCRYERRHPERVGRHQAA